MRVITFQDRFAELVRLGIKRQTIRQAARCKPGDTLSLRRWTGKPYRSRQETLRTVVCSEVVPIRIEPELAKWRPETETLRILTNVAVGGRWLTGEAREWLAILDGFPNFEAMFEWFYRYHGLPFCGVIIKWTVAAAPENGAEA